MEKLKESPADTVWILQPENRRYLSGFRATDMQMTESSGSLLIREDRRVLVTDSRYGEEAKREAPLFEVQVPAEGLLGRLPGLLAEMGCRVVGFELSAGAGKDRRPLAAGASRAPGGDRRGTEGGQGRPGTSGRRGVGSSHGPRPGRGRGGPAAGHDGAGRGTKDRESRVGGGG
ncbi:MAG: aminopeptidase P family N-terminal domain-containing protein [Deltaproteobacteria bacterium]|nr:aminopeptidase P family N-terminal domain-containing protein [Deltaproteobacteria bacterium]